jgi:hypothetical protein
MLALTLSTAFAGPCSTKVCTGGPPPFPPGHDEGTPAPVSISPTNSIVIDVTGAGILVKNTAFDGIVIDITGAGIVIDVTGAGLTNRPNVP